MVGVKICLVDRDSWFNTPFVSWFTPACMKTEHHGGFRLEGKAGDFSSYPDPTLCVSPIFLRNTLHGISNEIFGLGKKKGLFRCFYSELVDI